MVVSIAEKTTSRGAAAVSLRGAMTGQVPFPAAEKRYRRMPASGFAEPPRDSTTGSEGTAHRPDLGSPPGLTMRALAAAAIKLGPLRVRPL